MKVDKNLQEKINKLQLLEQNLQNFLIQKQNFQMQLLEINNANEELERSKGEVYKIAGNIMLKSEKTFLQKDLKEKKEIIELRIKNIEKQEEAIKRQASELQQEVMKVLEREK